MDQITDQDRLDAIAAFAQKQVEASTDEALLWAQVASWARRESDTGLKKVTIASVHQ